MSERNICQHGRSLWDYCHACGNDDKLNVTLSGENDNLNVNEQPTIDFLVGQIHDKNYKIEQLEESRRKVHSYSVDLLQSNLRNEKRIKELEFDLAFSGAVAQTYEGQCEILQARVDELTSRPTRTRYRQMKELLQRKRTRIAELENMLEALNIPKVPQSDEVKAASKQVIKAHDVTMLKLALSERDERIKELEAELAHWRDCSHCGGPDVKKQDK